MHGKLTKGPADAQKVDGSWRKFPPTHGMLMEGPADAQKVDGRSCSHTEVDCS